MGVDFRNFDLDLPMLWTVPDVLSAQECAQIVDRAEAAGVWLPGTVNSAQGRVVRRELRSNTVALVDEPELGAQVLARVNPPPVVSGRPLVRMKERMRIYRYAPGEAFALHRDQKYRGPGGEQSELSVLVYLNEGFEGGSTVFAEERKVITPRVGMAVVFQNMTLHGAERVESGVKYILRADVYYGARG